MKNPFKLYLNSIVDERRLLCACISEKNPFYFTASKKLIVTATPSEKSIYFKLVKSGLWGRSLATVYPSDKPLERNDDGLQNRKFTGLRTTMVE